MSEHENVHVVTNPQSGEVIQLPVGSRLELKFARRSLGISQWRVEERPANLVPLAEGRYDFQFLVFDDSGVAKERPLRLVRYRTDRPEHLDTSEVRDLTVLVTAS